MLTKDTSVDVIVRRLAQDDTLDERTGLPPEPVSHLIHLYLHSTYFQFKDAFYKQLKGAAMGSPLSPIDAQGRPGEKSTGTFHTPTKNVGEVC